MKARYAILIVTGWWLTGLQLCFADATLQLEGLIQEALEHNPVITAYQHKNEALWQRPPQAGAWEDPKLTFGVNNLPVDDFDFNKQDMTQKYVALTQEIPFPGVSALRERAAVEEAKSSRGELRTAETKTVSAVKTAYYRLAFVDASLAITAANEELLQQFVELTQTKYRVGRGLQEDILKAQVELYKMQEKRIDLKQQQATLQAEMNRLLGRAPGTPLEGKPQLTVTPVTLTAADLEAKALAANPLLQTLQHEIGRTQAENRLAKKSYVPKFSITASYGQRDDRPTAQAVPTRVTAADGSYNDVTTRPIDLDRSRPDFFSILVGVNIPIWFASKQNKKVAETFLLNAQAQSRYESAKNDVCFQVRDLAAKITRGRELIELYGERILPQAQQSLDANMAAYQVARIDFLTLLSSQLTLFNYEIQHRRSMTDYQTALAELEATIGERLF